MDPTPALLTTTDPVSQGIVAVLLIALFGALVIETAHRVLIALGAVALLFLVTYFTPYHLMPFERVAHALDLNVLALLTAMMALVGVFRTSGVLDRLAHATLARAGGHPRRLLTIIIWSTGIASAFLDNVTTVVFLTPLVIAFASQYGLRARVYLLPMIMASNIGGTATLIGDPPNILIGSATGLSFTQFLVTLTLPCVALLAWLDVFAGRVYRSELTAARASMAASPVLQASAPLALDRTMTRGLAIISGAILLGFFTHHITHMPVAIPATIGAALALALQDWRYLRLEKPTHEERIHGILEITERDIEWPTIAFFAMLFMLVGSAVDTGLIGRAAAGLQAGIAGIESGLGLGPEGAVLAAALLILVVSAVMSALVDNIPFVAVSIPIVMQLVTSMQGPTEVLWWSLSLGACLGGNATVIGASANVTATGLAERAGERITFRDFAAFGLPVAAVSVGLSAIVLALMTFGSSLVEDAFSLALALLLILIRRRVAA
jgi:Na+/H+ antiporter NhaD/arsenite permease-like protein